ncbi:hypothetical protein GMDG_01637 [Pseudogymnoascus destructans 20631-21]|uniref:UBC core domain-containing protein n=1 Tax=Pseudogymnoascus destructans (strain ATCC MYA-4855 / 20631-21) TaxID=658429 RepID=L8FW18_PSED2|nr:hypothetical protein GMDG_01637 [Pseudogymnoascus destructans 20631-21]
MPPSSKAPSNTSFHTARTTMPPPARSPLKRLHAELSALQSLGPRPSSDGSAIERLEPVDTDDLFKWEAVVPEAYPNAPPKVRFRTRVVGSNVDFETGEVCLDLLKDNWSPAYTLEKTVEAVALMLANPGVDSPLNVDIAALLRSGDAVGAESLVRWAAAETWGRYEGK